MRTKNLLKLAFTMLAMIVMTGAMAQVEESQYVEASGTTYHTTGQPLGLYARPDMSYSPDYRSDAVTPWSLNPNSEWKWVFGTDMSVTDANMIEDWANNNYVEIAAPAVGLYTISVAERNTNTGCADNTPVSQQVAVFSQPSINFRAADGVAWGDGCGNITAKTITLDLVAEGLASGLINATWQLQTMPVTIDGATGVHTDGTVDATNSFSWNKSTTATQTLDGVSWTMTDNGGFDATLASPALSTLTLAATLDFELGAGEVARKWVFSLVDGINDRISRKSDYITIAGGGSTSWYTGTTTDIEIYVVRAPETGPIYHIPNSYNN
ncbi:MAG: hypothetical protein PHT92_10870 [Bacteroidales bacterium]|nr:hypothetical protein [Bacteroidales bacterium]